MSGAQGTETDAEHPRRARLFGVRAAMASVVERFRAAFLHSSSGGESNVEERIRNVEVELEQARRLDGSASPGQPEG